MSEDHSAFVGSISHPSLGDGVTWGKIVFDRWRLRFISESVTREIPLVKLQIEIDQSAEGQISFCDPDQPDWSIRSFDREILEHRALRQQTHTRNQIQNFQNYGELKRRLKLTFWFLGGFAVVALLVSLLMGVMVRSLVAKVPAKWEQELGDTLLEELKKEEVFAEDPKLKARLDKAVAPLVAALPRTEIQYKFYVLQDSKPNAFALPGGHVLVNTGLLDLADRPEEIAGVVAHEIAHVTMKHGFRKIISAAGPYLIIRIFVSDGSGLLGMLGDSSQLLVRQSFSQEYELEADAVGWQYLMAAHIDPRALPEMLRKLQAEEDRTQGSQVQIGAFSSHPPTEKRIRRLEAKWNSLKEKPAFPPMDKGE